MAVTVVVVICAIGSGLGLAGLVCALRGQAVGVVGAGARPLRKSPPSAWITRCGLCLVTGAVVGVVTGWPVAGAISSLAALSLPSALRSTTTRDSTRRTEAIAVWTELLRDTLTASAGLSQSIVATAGVAPEELRVPVGHLADRIMSGVAMDDALRLFAVEIDNPNAHEVVSALRLAAASRAQRLVELLGALAESTREEVTMRLRVESSRASARSGVRTVIAFSIGFVAVLTLVARSYLAPFGTITGQLVLVLVGLFYAAGLTLMVRLVRPGVRRESVQGVRPR
jgi:tight adherence protein B